MVEFVLRDVVVAAISQVVTACEEKEIKVSCNLPEMSMTQSVYGDGIRLQQILSDFLFVSVKFSLVGGSIEISSKMTKKSIGDKLQLELRIKHQGGVPAYIMAQMFEEDNKEQSEEGLSLLVSGNLLRPMNGEVHHLREAGMSTFILTITLASSPKSSGQ